MAGADTDQQIKWREGTLGPYLKNGRSIHTPIIGPRHDVPHPTDQVEPERFDPWFADILSRKAKQSGGCCHGQQNGPYDLGGADPQ